MRTLVVHAGGVGDFILACPAIERLASAGTVVIAGYPERAAIAGHLAESIHDIDQIGFSSVFSTPNAQLRQFVRSFDRAVVWMNDTDGAIRRGIQACGVMKVHVQPGLPPADWRGHASDHYLAAIEAEPGGTFTLPKTDAAYHGAVLIHAGSGGLYKNWPLDNFVEVWRRLELAGLNVLWSRGPAEERLRLPSGARTRSPLTLVELGQWLANARGYLGNDSGITHLAAAAGCPTTAIFGPTDPTVWAPRGPHVRVVRADPWPTVDAVYRACQLAFGIKDT